MGLLPRSKVQRLVACTRLQEIDVAAFAVEPHAPEWAEFREHFPTCAECSREVARFAALTRALASEGSETAHLSEEQIVALASPSLQVASDELARLEAHLRGCAPCRTELAVVRRFELAAVAPAATRRRGPRWFPALGAAAAVVLAISAAALLWRTRETSTPSSPPPIAQAERPVTVVPSPPVAPPLPKPLPPPEPVTPAKPGPIAKQPTKPELAQARPPEPPQAVLVAALVPKEPPLYAAGNLEDGPAVRISGEARSLGPGAPVPEALGPAHVGATSHESPNLYFFLSEATSAPIEVTVTNPSVVAPVLETTLPGPLAAGLHHVSLAEHGARLEPNVEYRWFVALVRDPERRAQDAVSVAAIRLTPPGPEIRARLAAVAPASTAHLYAESGLWYDAFDQLSTWLAAEPDAVLLRNHRAALLEQVGLDDAAAFERRAAAP